MGATAIIAGASLIGSSMQSDASSSAADAQVQASNNANATQLHMFDVAQGNLQPYMQTGGRALSTLADRLGISGNTGVYGYGDLTQPFNADTFRQYLDPAYQWQLQQGNMALQNSQAAKDGVLSGAALKDLISYNQGMANTAYNNAFNQYQTQTGNIFQRLSSLAGLGQASAAGSAANAITTGANVGANQTAAGNATAAGIMGSANAWSGGLNNAAGYYALSNMMNPGGGAGGVLPGSAGTYIG